MADGGTELVMGCRCSGPEHPRAQQGEASRGMGQHGGPTRCGVLYCAECLPQSVRCALCALLWR